MRGNLRDPGDRAAALLLTLVVLLSQGLVLFNRSAFWDGVIFAYAHESRDYQAVFELVRQTGVAPTYVVHRLLGLLGRSPILAYRLAYLASVALSGYLLCRLLTAARIPRLVAVSAGALASVLPLAPVGFEISLLPGHLLIASFLAGARLLQQLVARASARAGRRLLAHGLLALSFFYGTCLFLALLASAASLLLTARERAAGRGNGTGRLRWLDFQALPWVFLAVKRLFLEPFGRYEGYNAIGPLDHEQIRNFLAVPFRCLLHSGGALLGPPARVDGLLSLVAAAVVLMLLTRRSDRLRDAVAELRGWPPRARGRFAAASLLLVYASVLPHFLVGRRTLAFEGYLSRDGMVPLFAVGALAAALVYAAPWFPRTMLAAAAAITLRLTVVQATTTLAWLDEDVSLTLMREALRADPNVKEARLVIFVDHATRFHHLEWLEFQHLLRSAFGDQSRMALPPFELARCESVGSCFRQFHLPATDPLSALAGARDAVPCGRLVRVEIDRMPASDATLAARGIHLRSEPLPPIPCADGEGPDAFLEKALDGSRGALDTGLTRP